ncbi:hypothetical protein IE53DRAFT_311395 [Violaceomyces palustris]|uniref:Uncharacterized protein n=1 Tax=Violaceomyces palustris TaxID=1673888 RepID=A0ACD0P3V7_9BASI|nr:hypothetical protein IE53DRAFT_311395 [Violaceomyces palustris]
MQLSSIVAFIAIGSAASASALPNILNSYELSQPIVERVVGTIECETEPVFTGKLSLVSTTGRASNAAFEGIRNAEGLQLLDVGKAGSAAKEEDFSFTVCKSPFMGYETIYDKAADVYFGRLQPAHLVGKRCVSASQLGTTDARLVAAKCSSSDDSGQLLQFWSLSQSVTNEGTKNYLNLLGKPADGGSDFPNAYIVSKVTQDNNKLVKLSKSNSAKSPYSLLLQ